MRWRLQWYYFYAQHFSFFSFNCIFIFILFVHCKFHIDTYQPRKIQSICQCRAIYTAMGFIPKNFWKLNSQCMDGWKFWKIIEILMLNGSYESIEMGFFFLHWPTSMSQNGDFFNFSTDQTISYPKWICI